MWTQTEDQIYIRPPVKTGYKVQPSLPLFPPHIPLGTKTGQSKGKWTRFLSVFATATKSIELTIITSITTSTS